ncbi:hypothetical protein EON64_06890 [archaeon]|nr:MAG: hypothetical protein EON64_06890 [archaeon]
MSASKGFFKEDKEEDKGLAPLTGRGLSPLRALGGLASTSSLARPNPLPTYMANQEEGKEEERSGGRGGDRGGGGSNYSTPSRRENDYSSTPSAFYSQTSVSQSFHSLLPAYPNTTSNQSQHDIHMYEDKVRSLEHTITHLNSSISTLQQTNTNLLNERSRLTDLVSSKDMSIAELRSEIFKHESEIMTLKKENNFLSMEKNTLAAMNQRLQDMLNNYPTNPVSTSAPSAPDTSNLAEEINRLQKQVQEHATQVNLLTQLQREIEQRNSLLQIEKNSASQLLAAQDIKLSELRDSVSNRDMQISELSFKYTEAIGQRNSVASKCVALEQELEQVKEQLSRQAGDYDNEKCLMQQYVNTKETQLQEVVDKNQQLQEKLFSAQTECEELSKQNVLMRLSISDESKYNLVCQQLEAQERKVKELIDSLERVEKERREGKQKYQDALLQVQQLNTKLSEQDNAAIVLRQQLDSLRTQRENVSTVKDSSSVELLELQIKELNTKLYSKEQQEASVKVQLANQVAELQDLQHKSQTWSTERQALMQEVQQHKLTIQDLSNRVAQLAGGSSTNQGMESETAELRRQSASLLLQLSESNSSKRLIEDEASRVRSELISLKQAYSQLQTNFETTVQSHSSSTSAATEDTTNYKLQLQSLQSLYNNMQITYNSVLGDKNKLSDALLVSEQNFHSIKSELQQVTLKYNEMCYNQDVVNNQVKQHKDMLIVKDKAIQDLQSQLQAKQREIMELTIKQDEATYKLSIAGASASSSTLSSQPSQSLPSHQQRQLENTIAELRGKIESLLQEKTSLYEQVLDLQIEKSKLEHNLRTAESEVSSKVTVLERKIKTYQEEVLGLQRQLVSGSSGVKATFAPRVDHGMQTHEVESGSTGTHEQKTSAEMLIPSASMEQALLGALSKLIATMGAQQISPSQIKEGESEVVPTKQQFITGAPSPLPTTMLHDYEEEEVTYLPKSQRTERETPVPAEQSNIAALVKQFYKYSNHFLSYTQSCAQDMRNISSGIIAQLVQLLGFRKEQESFFSKMLADFLGQCKHIIANQRASVKILKSSSSANNNKQIVQQVNTIIAQLNSTIRCVKELQHCSEQRDQIFHSLVNLHNSLSALDGNVNVANGSAYYNASLYCEQLHEHSNKVNTILHSLLKQVEEEEMPVESYFNEHTGFVPPPRVHYAIPHPHPAHYGHGHPYPTYAYPPPPPPTSSQSPPFPTSYPPSSHLYPGESAVQSKLVTHSRHLQHVQTPASSGAADAQGEIIHKHQLGNKHQLEVVMRQIDDICRKQDSKKSVFDQYYK